MPIVLGFDFRRALHGSLPAGEWPDQRRSQHLLRTDVHIPLSVDTNVWPSLFIFEDESSIPASSNIRVKPIGFHERLKRKLRREENEAPEVDSGPM